jgi:uncharacterized protein
MHENHLHQTVVIGEHIEKSYSTLHPMMTKSLPPQDRFQLPKAWFKKFRQDVWDNPEKYIILGLIGVSGVILTWLAWCYVQRNLLPYRLTLAAGRDTGESYILSDAIARILKKNSNVKIEVCSTDGTDDNIKSLAGKPLTQKAICQSNPNSPTQNLKADLATAQADRSAGASARVVATLYEDKFQLVVNPQKVQLPQNLQDFRMEALKGKIIETPQGGGQRKSFEDVAKHLNLKFNFLNLSSNPQNADAIFRVRTLANEEIRSLIDRGWKLVPIPQARAMQETQHPAYIPSVIPKGAYRGSPETDLETIAVQRTLLANQNIPPWVVEKIAAVLSDHRQELKEAVKQIAQERQNSPKRFDPEAIQPLIDRFSKPDKNGTVQLHPGAIAYYDRDKPPFISEHADAIAIGLTLLAIGWSCIVQTKSWLDRHKQRDIEISKQRRKDTVDRYIEKAVDKMKLTTSETSYTTPKQLNESLQILFKRQEELNQLFQEASESLEQEHISQDGFRSFSETYKSTREVIEQAIEDRQRRIVSSYVNQVKELLKRMEAGEEQAVLLQELYQLRNEAADRLLQDQTFSRESFRTFVDAYQLVQDAIERRTTS